MKSKIFRKADSLAEAAGYYQDRTAAGPRRAGDTRPAAVRLAESEAGEDEAAPRPVERSNPSLGTYTPTWDIEAEARVLRAIAREDGTEEERAAWQRGVDGGYCPFCIGKEDGATDNVVCYCCRRNIAQ